MMHYSLKFLAVYLVVILNLQFSNSKITLQIRCCAIVLNVIVHKYEFTVKKLITLY